MKKVIVLICSVLVLVFAAKYTVSSNKNYIENERVDLFAQHYIGLVVQSGDQESWGFDKDDDLDEITVGEGILLYLCIGNKILDDDLLFYPIYCGGKMRTGIIMQGDQFVTTTGGSGYLSDYIALCYLLTGGSDYSVLSFRDQYLLMFDLDGETYLIGEVYQFSLPKGAFRLSIFFECFDAYVEEYRRLCPDMNCVG